MPGKIDESTADEKAKAEQSALAAAADGDALETPRLFGFRLGDAIVIPGAPLDAPEELIGDYHDEFTERAFEQAIEAGEPLPQIPHGARYSCEEYIARTEILAELVKAAIDESRRMAGEMRRHYPDPVTVSDQERLQSDLRHYYDRQGRIREKRIELRAAVDAEPLIPRAIARALRGGSKIDQALAARPRPGRRTA